MVDNLLQDVQVDSCQVHYLYMFPFKLSKVLNFMSFICDFYDFLLLQFDLGFKPAQLEQQQQQQIDQK